MEAVVDKITLQSSGAYEETGDSFSFWAKSISEKEICEPMMDILITQAPNQPFIFRHRHPAGNDDKVVPIFGRIGEAKKETFEGKKYIVSKFNIPLKSPYGHELTHNKVFVDWIKESYEANTPIGISFAFLKYLEEKDGKKQAYWVDLYEASGTHIPACVDCTHIKGGVAMSVNENAGQGDTTKSEKKVEQKEKYKELEAQLEAMTLEKKNLEKEIGDLHDGNGKLVEALEQKDGAIKLLMEQVTKLADGVNALEQKLEYAETMKPLVDKIIKLEKRPELESFYRTQTKEYLEAEIKRLEGPMDANVDSSDVANRILKGFKNELEFTPPTREELEKKIDPTLLPMMKEFWEKGGR